MRLPPSIDRMATKHPTATPTRDRIQMLIANRAADALRAHLDAGWDPNALLPGIISFRGPFGRPETQTPLAAAMAWAAITPGLDVPGVAERALAVVDVLLRYGADPLQPSVRNGPNDLLVPPIELLLAFEWGSMLCPDTPGFPVPPALWAATKKPGQLRPP